MNIYISDDTNTLQKIYRKDLLYIVNSILTELGLSGNTELSIHFTDDSEMRSYNKSYRNLDRTTDVLSFPQGYDEQTNILGDILISIDAVKRQADIYDVTIDEEIERLIVHGILHLLGFDHKTKKQREDMRNRESALIHYINNLE